LGNQGGLSHVSAQTTDATGGYMVPNVGPDTYSVEVRLEGFKTVTRKNMPLRVGDRAVVPSLTVEVGGAAETVNVQAELSDGPVGAGARSFRSSTRTSSRSPK
jgi:hypothetical protein